MPDARSAGILLHLTSLSSRFGIGDMGPAAFEFVDFLAIAGQRVWQILPLCPTTLGNSPYSSYSAFAGNMLLISPEFLVRDGWLTEESLLSLCDEFGAISRNDPSQVDFDYVAKFKGRVLQVAFDESFEELSQSGEFKAYCDDQNFWLDDFARFEALRQHFGNGDWRSWPSEFRQPKSFTPSQLDQFRSLIQFSRFKQFLFDAQWKQLKSYANEKRIQICGDMPIFVALDSSDVWANQEEFLLDENGSPTSVAGVPPDYFSETGQLWGNPLYDWATMEANGYAWWCDRFRRALSQFDLLRVDHFRGFDRYWQIPADAETAVSGTWEQGPGEKPFRAAEAQLGPLSIWAEDLGDIDEGVHQLRDQLGFPTMRVMQFGYSTEHDAFHRHTSFPEHCIGYTGTHDNNTLMGWFADRQQHYADGCHDPISRYLHGEEEVHFQLIRLLYQTAANVAIIPWQDLLGLGEASRMNVPGVAEGNWQWRMTSKEISNDLAERLRQIVAESNRLHESYNGPQID